MARLSLRWIPSLALLLLPSLARAQWIQNGSPISVAASRQWSPAIASDGAGGAIIAWHDLRSGDYDIYVQRVNASGAAQWAANGVAVCTAASEQSFPEIVPDGAGGVIIIWHDYRSLSSYDIYAQRVSASGAPQWAANGVALCTATGDQLALRIAADGAGGAIATWEDPRSGSWDIYARRIDASGAAQWTANGVALCQAANTQSNPQIVSDGAGGAIVTWQDFRNGAADIAAQRVSASGSVQWASNGVWVTTAAADQVNPAIASDGAGGAIVAWEDYRGLYAPDIYAQRMNAAGVEQWTFSGVKVCEDVRHEVRPAIASDGAGGALIAWSDSTYVSVQRMSPSGGALWGTCGRATGAAGGGPGNPRVASDGGGGAIVTWQSWTGPFGDSDIYTQQLIGGSEFWPVTAPGYGLPVCAGVSWNQYGPALVTNGTHAIVTWTDDRAASNVGDIYAQRIEGQGYWGYPEPIMASVADFPADQGGRVRATWIASQYDVRGFDTVTHYSLWREVSPIAAGDPNAAGTDALDPSRIGSDFAGKGSRVVPGPNGVSTTWEFIATVPIRYAAQYAYTVSTLSDSTPGNPADETYQVLAHTNIPFVFFESNMLSGHSVDNLVPDAPLSLIAQRVSSDVHLHWSQVGVSDLRDYGVYRSSSPGVTPVPTSFLASANDTALVDAGAPAGPLFYVVTAYDVHGNQGPPSNEASVAATTGVGDQAPITVLTVYRNFPNPFVGRTEFRIGLPERSDVEVEVYDVAGRRVARRVLTGVEAGWRTVPFEARDDRSRPLRSGVYSCRFTASGSTVTHRVVVAR